MNREDVKKAIQDADIYVDTKYMYLFMETYREFLVDELYAIQNISRILGWINSENDYPFPIEAESIRKSADTIANLESLRHGIIDCGSTTNRKYKLIEDKTENDFFGGLKLRGILEMLDLLPSLLNND